MAAWFAGRRAGTRGARRTALRGVLAAVIGAVLVCVAGLTVVAAGASAGGSSGSSIAVNLAGAETSPAVITFEDNFDGPRGAPPDSAKWIPKVQTHAQPGATGIQDYTDNKNAFLDGDGHLVIEARKESQQACPDPSSNGPCYTSARLSTKGRFSQQGGLFEARIKMPIGNSPTAGGGLWPAWWLLGRNDRKWPSQGEIDINEGTGQQSVTHGFFHTQGGSFGGDLTLPGLDLNQFNTFAVDVEPTEITWYIDTTQVQKVTRSEFERKNPGATWVADQPWYLILNLAVGGWPGPPSASLPFPKEMVVDWVRTSCPNGTISSGPEELGPASTDQKSVRCASSPGQ
jgi:beta-glucanase (GH16 family)